MRKLRSRKNLIIEGLNNPYIIESVDKSVNAKLFSFCKRVGLDKKDIKNVYELFTLVVEACEYVSDCDFTNPEEKFESIGRTGDLTGVEFGIHKFLLYAYYTSSVPSKEIFDSVESYLRKKISGNVEKVRSGRLNIKKYDAFDVIVQIVRGSKLIIGVEVMGDADEPTDEGFPGTEIGLPLDRENCESTDASGISTPTGTVGSGKKISVDSDRHIICPECKSDNVNIHNNGTIFHCVDCGNEWPTSDSDNNGIEDDEESRDHFIDRDDKKLVKEDTTRKVVEACISESYIEDRDGNKLDSITLHSTEWCWFYSDNGIKYTIHCVRGKMKVFKDGTREVKPTKDMKSKVKVEV